MMMPFRVCFGVLCFIFFSDVCYADSLDNSVHADDAGPADPSLVEQLEAEIVGLPLEEMSSRLQELMQLIIENAEKSQELQATYQSARVEAQGHPTIRAMHDEINAMRQKLEQAIDELPEVKEVKGRLEESKLELLELLQFRTRLDRTIAIREQIELEADSVDENYAP